jgi:hypothetical protein
MSLSETQLLLTFVTISIFYFGYQISKLPKNRNRTLKPKVRVFQRPSQREQASGTLRGIHKATAAKDGLLANVDGVVIGSSPRTGDREPVLHRIHIRDQITTGESATASSRMETLRGLTRDSTAVHSGTFKWGSFRAFNDGSIETEIAGTKRRYRSFAELERAHRYSRSKLSQNRRLSALARTPGSGVGPRRCLGDMSLFG